MARECLLRTVLMAIAVAALLWALAQTGRYRIPSCAEPTGLSDTVLRRRLRGADVAYQCPRITTGPGRAVAPNCRKRTVPETKASLPPATAQALAAANAENYLEPRQCGHLVCPYYAHPSQLDPLFVALTHED